MDYKTYEKKQNAYMTGSLLRLLLPGVAGFGTTAWVEAETVNFFGWDEIVGDNPYLQFLTFIAVVATSGYVGYQGSRHIGWPWANKYWNKKTDALNKEYYGKNI